MNLNIPDRLSVGVSIPVDREGLMARECPKCEKIFKVKTGTGITVPGSPCHCAYCGHVASHQHFHTEQQMAYAKSVAMRHFTDQLHSELKKLESHPLSIGPFRMSWKVQARSPYPIHYHYGKALETNVVCDQCNLVYAIYGEFAFCPDCGSHNSITILNKNIEFVEKMLNLAETQERELSERLVGDALENLVSAFDGFGREVCRVAAPKATKPDEAIDVRFQNLPGAQTRVQKLFGLSLPSMVSPDDWVFICKCFQKRHVLAHKMGVVDDDYLKATGDQFAMVGRKIQVQPLDVKRLGTLLAKLGDSLVKQLV